MIMAGFVLSNPTAPFNALRAGRLYILFGWMGKHRLYHWSFMTCSTQVSNRIFVDNFEIFLVQAIITSTSSNAGVGILAPLPATHFSHLKRSKEAKDTPNNAQAQPSS